MVEESRFAYNKDDLPTVRDALGQVVLQGKLASASCANANPFGFKLRFELAEIAERAADYGKPEDDDDVIRVGGCARERGHYTAADLAMIGDWKSARARGRRVLNDDAYVREVTGVALSTSCERLRIEVLTLLDGVGWPTASVLLHLGHRDRYPILDFRAVEALNFKGDAPHTFAFWWAYTVFCRDLAEKAGVSMRVLDRALWAYSAKGAKG
jgi:hypothetical protein